MAEKFRTWTESYLKAQDIMEVVQRSKSDAEAIQTIYNESGGKRSPKTIGKDIIKAREILNKTHVSFLERVWNDILDFIYSFFSGKHADLRDVEDLFAKINQGRFSNTKFTTQAKADYKKDSYIPTAIGRIKSKGQEITEVNTNEQINKITKGLTSILINKNKLEDLDDVGGLNVSKAMEPVLDSLRKKIPLLKASGTERNLRLFNLYSEVLADLEKGEGKSAFRELIHDYLYIINIRKNAAEIIEAEEEENEEQESGKEKFDMATYQVNSKANTLASIKYMIATLPASNTADEFTDFFEFVDFDKMWSSLMRDLHDKTTIKQMIDTLKSKPTNYAYQKLAAKLENSTKMTKSKFLTSFRMHRHDFINMWLRTTDNGSLDPQPSHADTQRASKKLVAQWNEDLFGSDLITKNSVTKYSPNESKIRSVQNDYNSLVLAVKNAYSSSAHNFTSEQSKTYVDKLRIPTE